MLKRRLLASLTLSYCAGISFAFFLEKHLLIAYVAAILPAVFLLFFKKERIKRISACLICAVVGLTYTALLMNAGRIDDIEDSHIVAAVKAVDGESAYIVDDIIINGEPISGKARLTTYEPIDALPGQKVELNNASLYTPKGKNYPGGFDYRTYLMTNGTRYAIYASKGTAFGEPGGIALFLNSIKTQLSENIDNVFYDNADIIKALVLGIRSDITDEVYENFRLSGTVHVLALSGLHISALTMVLFWLCEKIGLKYRLHWLIVGPVMLFYCALVGFSSSISRAVLMAAMLYLAGCRLRRYDSVTSISVAAAVLLCINPLTLFDAGFILSFSSVLGIVLMSDKIKSWLSFLPENIAKLASVSLGAQIGILPFQIMFYGAVSPFSVFANLLVVPMIGVMLAFGYLSAILGFVLPSVAVGAVCAPGYALAEAVKLINSICAAVPFGSVNLHDPWALVVVLYYTAVILLFCVKKYKSAAVCALICAAIFAFEPLAYRKNELTWTAYSVGNADASLVQCKDRSVLIDTGEKDSRIYSALLAQGITPDAVFLTHGHDDHAGGIGEIVKNNGAKNVIVWQGMTANDVESSAAQGIALAYEEGAEIQKACAGDVFQYGDIKVSIVAPYEKSGNANRDSMVILVEGQGHKILFMGDADSVSELYVPSVDVDAIKIGHHGSNTSTSANFLSRISPEYAIISAGRNSYGHPSKEVLERLDEIGTNTFLTNELSSVRIRFLKNDVRISHYDNGRWRVLDLR